MKALWKLGFRRISEMALIVVIGTLFALAANQIVHHPLPLWTVPSVSPGASGQPASEGKSPVTATLPVLDVDTVAQLAGDPATLLLDARQGPLYRQGHLPGAVSLPVSEFFLRFEALRASIERAGMVIVYCIDPRCPDARSLGALLVEHGVRKVLLFEGGIEEWKRRGHALAMD